MAVHSDMALHRCDYCGNSYRYRDGLTRHIRKVHKIVPTKVHKIVPTMHKCEMCKKQFLSREDLERHMLIHTG